MNNPLFYGDTIFCDDIRDEVGGKKSFIGVYEGTMYVHGDFPFSLPKFGFVVRYIEKIGSCSHDVTLRIFMPGENDKAVLEGMLPIQRMRNVSPPSEMEPPPEYMQMSAAIIMSPLVIQKSGMIRVEAQCGADIINLGRLRILRAPQKKPEKPV